LAKAAELPRRCRERALRRRSGLSWQVNDSHQDRLRRRFHAQQPPPRPWPDPLPTQTGSASRDTYIWEKGSDNLLHNDNNMAQVRFEHLLNDNWTLAGGMQWLDGTLQGNAVEANGALADGRTCSATSTTASWSGPTATTSSTSPATSTPARSATPADRVENKTTTTTRSSSVLGSRLPDRHLQPGTGPAAPGPDPHHHPRQGKPQDLGLFIQDQVALTERLKALAGVRFERFEHDYDNKLQCRQGLAGADNAVTPRFGLLYDLTDTVAVYANTARSFKPNTGASRQGDGFDPEKGKSYELG
jgi:iron complex outermembrane receptor protein